MLLGPIAASDSYGIFFIMAAFFVLLFIQWFWRKSKVQAKAIVEYDTKRWFLYIDYCFLYTEALFREELSAV